MCSRIKPIGKGFDERPVTTKAKSPSNNNKIATRAWNRGVEKWTQQMLNLISHPNENSILLITQFSIIRFQVKRNS